MVDLLLDDDVQSVVSGWFPESAATVITRAVRAAAAQQGFQRGQIGVRLTGDATIREINREFLSHDYATDVISFGYGHDQDSRFLEGELVASVETALSQAIDNEQTPDNELILYVVHGTLHIAGLDDQDDASRAEMRRAEAESLRRFTELTATEVGVGRGGASR
ncbi:MAG: rRNA maturation RNase YbeY [Planctomycetota bacterium]